jgi:hypothetical protein
MGVTAGLGHRRVGREHAWPLTPTGSRVRPAVIATAVVLVAFAGAFAAGILTRGTATSPRVATGTSSSQRDVVALVAALPAQQIPALQSQSPAFRRQAASAATVPRTSPAAIVAVGNPRVSSVTPAPTPAATPLASGAPAGAGPIHGSKSPPVGAGQTISTHSTSGNGTTHAGGSTPRKGTGISTGGG